ncbi:hypothetical protein NL455_28190, partial [Klebsiella pneumoniae]|nr:hypothetical protein [Klebsiella pneumoniae]
MSELIVPASLLLYLLVPTWLLTRGKPISAGLSMIAVALLPWAVWFVTATELSGPGTGVAMLITAAM